MVDRTELREALAKEGKKFDGHVINGSLEAMMVVVEDAIAKALVWAGEYSGYLDGR